MKRVQNKFPPHGYKTQSKLKKLFQFKKNSIMEPISFPEEGKIDPFGYLHVLDEQKTKDYIANEKWYSLQYKMSSNMKKFYLGFEKELNFVLNSTRAKISAQEYNNGYLYIQMEANYKLPVYMRLKTNDPQFLTFNQITKRFKEFEVVLDQNVIYNSIPGVSYFHINKIKLNHDQNKVLYLVDLSGNEKYHLGIHSLPQGREIDQIQDQHILNAEFSPNGNEVYYTLTDSLMRPYKVMKHKIGENQALDVEIYTEKDPTFFVDLSKTKDNKFVTVNINNKTTSETHVIDEFGAMRLIQRRIDGTNYFVEHNNGNFYFVTNADHASNFKVMQTKVETPEKSNWTTLVESQEKVRIEDLDMLRDNICLYEKENGVSRIRSIDLKEKTEQIMEAPMRYSNISPGMNGDFEAKNLYFSFQNPLHDEKMAVINLDDKSVKQLDINMDREILNQYCNPDHFVIRRVVVKSHDGVRVPMTIVYDRRIPMDGSTPAIMYGYVTYEAQRLALLRRGFTLAFAHVRGGGELGQSWHDSGKKLNKMNSFHDFIACAEFLVDEKWTNPSKLCAKGVSAGGLLLGSVANMRGDLFQSMILKVPFLDVYGTMMDTALPLTEYEYEEWGNIKDPIVKEYIKSYSPYQNIQAQRYPNMLISASMNDYRAPYWNALKYVAKLRSNKTGASDVVLQLSDVGHSDDAGKNAFQDGIVSEYSFLFSTMDIKQEMFI